YASSPRVFPSATTSYDNGSWTYNQAQSAPSALTHRYGNSCVDATTRRYPADGPGRHATLFLRECDQDHAGVTGSGQRRLRSSVHVGRKRATLVAGSCASTRWAS